MGRRPALTPFLIALLTALSSSALAGDHFYDPYIVPISRRHGVDPLLVKAIIKAESRFNPGAVSSKGARGLMQLIPSTAWRFGVRNPFDPRENIEGGIRYLRFLTDLFDGSLPLVLAGYNAGENAVIASGYRIPPYRETLEYVPRVLSYYQKYRFPMSELSEAKKSAKSRRALPAPRIISVAASTPFARVGLPLYVRIVGLNDGSASPAGGITLAFPEIPDTQVSCQTDGNGRCAVYVEGASIASYPRQRLIAASYPVIEAWHEAWEGGAGPVLDVVLVPREPGRIRMLVRMALQHSQGYVGYPATSDLRDQQGWAVESYTLMVY